MKTVIMDLHAILPFNNRGVDPYHIKIGEAATNGPEHRASFHRLHLRHKKRRVTKAPISEQIYTFEMLDIDTMPAKKVKSLCR